MKAKSVRVLALCDGEFMSLDITRDGQMIFVDHDIEYDLSMCEFGEELGTCDMYKLWYDEPWEIITETFSLEETFVARLVVDWAEHVLPIFELSSKDPTPREVIEITKEFIDYYIKNESKENLGTYGNFLFMKRRIDRNAQSADMLLKIKAAEIKLDTTIQMVQNRKYNASVEHSVTSVNYAMRGAGWRVGLHAAQAAGYSASPSNAFDAVDPSSSDTYEFVKASREETAWQIRRFIDTLVATQRALPWPPLGTTE